MKEPVQPLAEQELASLRDQALSEASKIMFPDLQDADVGDTFGPPEYTQRRLDALTTIRRWLDTEFGWMEHQAFKDQPWEVRYACVGNEKGDVRRTYDTKGEAEREAARANPSASFGYYIVRQSRRPLDP